MDYGKEFNNGLKEAACIYCTCKMSTWALSDHATGIFVSYQPEVVSAQKAVEEKRLRLGTTVSVWWVSKKKLDTTEAARRSVEKANLPESKVDASHSPWQD